MVDVAESQDQAHWYAIQTYSGHENKVKTLLERKIQDLPGEPGEKAAGSTPNWGITAISPA